MQITTLVRMCVCSLLVFGELLYECAGVFADLQCRNDVE